MKYIICGLLLISHLLMASNEPSSHQTDPNKVYLLKALNTSSITAPALVMFDCYLNDKLLGPAMITVSPQNEPELLHFWTPLLEKISNGGTVTLEVRGGRFSYTQSSNGEGEPNEGWVAYTPAVYPRLSDLRIITASDEKQP